MLNKKVNTKWVKINISQVYCVLSRKTIEAPFFFSLFFLPLTRLLENIPMKRREPLIKVSNYISVQIYFCRRTDRFIKMWTDHRLYSQIIIVSYIFKCSSMLT